MKRNVFILSLILFVFASCKKDTTMVCACDPQILSAGIQLNVAYGSDPLQKMDVYLPQGRSVGETPVIIMIHGGAWTSGDKADMTAYVDSLQNRLPGYAIININYRLASFTGNTFPTQENDVKAATDFIYGKLAEYNVSDKLVMLGVSAGSHLALLQAYKYSSPKIKAVVDFFGPTDLADMYNNPASSQAPPAGIALLLNGVPPGALYTSSSPINFVTMQTPPTIILQGGADSLVRYQQSAALDAKLTANGISHQYVFYPTEGHGWYGANLVDSFNKVQAFLSLYIQ